MFSLKLCNDFSNPCQQIFEVLKLEVFNDGC